MFGRIERRRKCFGLAAGPAYQMEITAGVAFPNLC
jgi:hypothetical protein